MFACTFFFLHGAGCLPVNSVSAPESAIITYTWLLIAPPHRGIHHAEVFLINSKQKNQALCRLFLFITGHSNTTMPQTSTPSASTDMILLVRSTITTRNSRSAATARRSFTVTGDSPDEDPEHRQSLPAPCALPAQFRRLPPQWPPPHPAHLPLHAYRVSHPQSRVTRHDDQF